MPKKSQKYSKKVKKSNRIKLSKRFFKYYTRKYNYNLVSPFNIKHLNYKGNKERFLKYFQLVNQSIERARAWASINVSRNYLIRSDYLSPINISEKEFKLDGFNIMMKEKFRA